MHSHFKLNVASKWILNVSSQNLNFLISHLFGYFIQSPYFSEFSAKYSSPNWIIGEPVFQTEQFLCLLGTNRLTEMVMVAVWWWLGALLLTSLASAAYYVILLTSVPLRNWFLAIAINGTKVTTYTPGTHLT